MSGQGAARLNTSRVQSDTPVLGLRDSLFCLATSCLCVIYITMSSATFGEKKDDDESTSPFTLYLHLLCSPLFPSPLCARSLLSRVAQLSVFMI